MDVITLIQQNIEAQESVLDLGGMNLTTLPPEIGQAVHVTRLSLRRNQLMTLPPEIGQLTQLQILSAADNELEWLPAEIGQLHQLRQINLKNNKLIELPVEMLDLDQLELLRLDGNALELPDDILRKWDRPADILDYYQKYCVPEPEPEVLSIERKLAIYFNDQDLIKLADMLCVPEEEVNAPTHDERAEQLVAYHTKHGLAEELISLLDIYRPGYF
ncbi:MAG: leucine-rich repeat domain-containing protein [Chloroflexota bacterium]